MTVEATERTAYARAGVDLEAADEALGRVRARPGRTSDLLGRFGGFAAALPLAAEGYADPVVVASADGVGTKTELARQMGRLDTIGQDLVAMCVDDVVCHGARPRWFLDYLAVGRVDRNAVATLVGGVAGACEAVGCELVGGETAEHPGVMAPDAFDLAGFCIGLVERDRLIDGAAARARDAVLGLASSGLHANGFSLVRAVVERERLDLDAPFGSAGGSLGDALLTPTRLYAAVVLELLDALREGGARVGGLAHVTGGGLPGNLPRAVGPHLAVEVDPASWPVHPVVQHISRVAGLSGAELRATFNAGIGMAVVVEPDAAAAASAFLAERGLGGWRIGRVVPAVEAGPSRYREVERA